MADLPQRPAYTDPKTLREPAVGEVGGLEALGGAAARAVRLYRRYNMIGWTGLRMTPAVLRESETGAGHH